MSMGYRFAESFEPPDDELIGICAACLGEIYAFEQWSEDDSGRLVHIGVCYQESGGNNDGNREEFAQKE